MLLKITLVSGLKNLQKILKNSGVIWELASQPSVYYSTMWTSVQSRTNPTLNIRGFLVHHRFLHVLNYFSGYYRAILISFYVEYLCITFNIPVKFFDCLHSRSKIFHQPKWKFEIICKCVSLGTCSNSTMAITRKQFSIFCQAHMC